MFQAVYGSASSHTKLTGHQATTSTLQTMLNQSHTKRTAKTFISEKDIASTTSKTKLLHLLQNYLVSRNSSSSAPGSIYDNMHIIASADQFIQGLLELLQNSSFEKLIDLLDGNCIKNPSSERDINMTDQISSTVDKQLDPISDHLIGVDNMHAESLNQDKAKSCTALYNDSLIYYENLKNQTNYSVSSIYNGSEVDTKTTVSKDEYELNERLASNAKCQYNKIHAKSSHITSRSTADIKNISKDHSQLLHESKHGLRSSNPRKYGRFSSRDLLNSNCTVRKAHKVSGLSPNISHSLCNDSFQKSESTHSNPFKQMEKTKNISIYSPLTSTSTLRQTYPNTHGQKPHKVSSTHCLRNALQQQTEDTKSIAHNLTIADTEIFGHTSVPDTVSTTSFANSFVKSNGIHPCDIDKISNDCINLSVIKCSHLNTLNEIDNSSRNDSRKVAIDAIKLATDWNTHNFSINEHIEKAGLISESCNEDSDNLANSENLIDIISHSNVIVGEESCNNPVKFPRKELEKYHSLERNSSAVQFQTKDFNQYIEEVEHDDSKKRPGKFKNQNHFENKNMKLSGVEKADILNSTTSKSWSKKPPRNNSPIKSAKIHNMKRIGEIFYISVGASFSCFLQEHPMIQGVHLHKGKRKIKHQLVHLCRKENLKGKLTWNRGKDSLERNRFDDFFELTDKGFEEQTEVLEGRSRDQYVVNWYVWCPGHSNCQRKCGGFGKCIQRKYFYILLLNKHYLSVDFILISKRIHNSV